MTIFKPLLSFILVVACLPAFCQTADQPVLLKWKLKRAEAITYQTEMKIIKDSTLGMNGFFNNFFKNINPSTKDSSDKMPNMDIMLNQMRKQMDESPSYLTTMTWKGATINVEMLINGGDSSRTNFASLAKLFDTSAMRRVTSPTKHKPSTKKQNPSSMKPDTMMNSFFRSAMFMMRRVMLRGAINEDGSVSSFYVNTAQRNLLGLFFGLPAKPVKVGDSWPVDVHLVTADQNFICDSASRENKATVADVKFENGQHIVTVKYNLREKIVGTSNMPFGSSSEKTSETASYQGTARFSVEKGRWIFYDCLLTEDLNGIVTSHKETKYSLAE